MAKTVLIFLLTYFSGIVAIFLVDISWGIYLYELVYFLNPTIRWWGRSAPDLRYSFVVSVAILIAFILYYHRYQNTKVFSAPQAKWLMVMMIMLCTIRFWAVWPEWHERVILSQGKLIVYLAIAYKVIDSKTKFERMLWAFLIGNFYIGLEAFKIGRTGRGRLEGIGMADGIQANDTAAVLITSVPILLFFLLKGGRWKKITSIIFGAFIVNAIVLLNSRGAVIGMICSMAYFLFQYTRYKANSKNYFKIFGLVTFCLICFFYMTDAIFWERMFTLQEVSEGGGGAGRVNFWMLTFDLVREHPFGVGVWGYQYLSPMFMPEGYLTDGMRAVHSTYFQMLAEYGYVGPFLLAAIILSNFRLIKKMKNAFEGKDEYLFFQVVAIESGLIAFLIAAAFIDRLYAEVFYWFMLYIAIMNNLYLLNKQDANNLTES